MFGTHDKFVPARFAGTQCAVQRMEYARAFSISGTGTPAAKSKAMVASVFWATDFLGSRTWRPS